MIVTHFSVSGIDCLKDVVVMFGEEGVFAFSISFDNILLLSFRSPAVCPLMPNMQMTRPPKRPMPTAPGNLGHLILIASPRSTLRS